VLESGSVVRKVGEIRVWAADLALEAGAGDLKRAVGAAGLEADDLAIGQAAVLGFELAVDQSVRGAEVITVAGLGDDGDLELGAIAEIMVAG
jgi:hypothetical protein